MPLNCTFKMVKNGTFYVIYLYTHTIITQTIMPARKRSSTMNRRLITMAMTRPLGVKMGT